MAAIHLDPLLPGSLVMHEHAASDITGLSSGGVPAGGTTDQVLAKINNTDYNTQWVDQTGGSYTLPTADATTLGGIKVGSRLTIAAGVLSADVQTTDISGLVTKATYDANTILYATADNTPLALTIGASTIVGRKATGDIVALTATEVRAILNVADGANAGATKALDNLASVAINTSLISDTDSTDDLGSTTKYWANGYINTIYTTSISTGPGTNANLVLLPNGTGITVIGNAAATSHTLNTNNDLFVKGKLEIDGEVYADNKLIMADEIIFGNNINLHFGSGTGLDTILKYGTAQTVPAMVYGLNDNSKMILFLNWTNRSGNYAHAAQTNPTIFIHSAIGAATATNQWLSLTHNQTNGVIDVGTGYIQMADSVLMNDSVALTLGTGADASIYYDGTNLVVNPKLVGTGNLNILGDIAVSGTKVIGARVIDARADDVANSGDATTDGLIDALRDAMIAHGLIAAA